MKQKILITIIALSMQLPMWAATHTGDGDKKTGDKKSKEKGVVAKSPATKTFAYSPATTRQFASLTKVAEEVVIQTAFQEGLMLDGTDPIDSIRYHIAKARATIDKIRETGNFVKQLDEQSLFDLPVGISRTVGNLEYTIGITSMELKPTHAELEAYMQFTIPQNGKTLTFHAKGIKFTKAGGIVGDATLALVGDYGINFNADKSQLILKEGVDGTGTFVTMDCDGFKEMGIDAEVKFSRDMLVPENEAGEIQQGNVIGSFKTQLSDWNDLVVQINLPDFQVAKMDGVGFSVKDAVFDFSDLRNAPAVKFPEGYESTQMLPNNPNLWRGFYLRELTVRLPSQFETKDGTGRTSFEAHDLLIDNMGFSGTLIAKNLINRDQGDMNGWAFSLDSLGIELQANQLKEASFNGDIIIPIADDQTPFTYTALINPGNEYIFNISAAADLQFEVFKTSKVEIYEASYLEIKVANGKFRPKANLHGRMNINAKMGDSESSKSVSLADISFEDLTLQSVKPYVQVGAFSFGSEATEQVMAKLPISINNIGMRSLSDTQVGLDFDINVNLNKSFGGAAGLTIVGNIDSDKGYQSWRFKRIDVNEIMIDIDQGAFKFYGKLTFFRNDQTYGNGFNGILDAEFKPGIKVKATAVFGGVNDIRYWYADALVEFNNGIPIFTGVGIYGFGGGAYYAMKMDTEGLSSDLGTTNSGVVYVPDAKAGLGLKATVVIGSHPSPKAFNSDATFEISFFKGGGVRYMAFSGNAYIMTPPMGDKLSSLKDKIGKVADAVDKLGENTEGLLAGAVTGGVDNSAVGIYGEIGTAAGKQGAISAHMMVSYDFENRVLHGNFEMYINVEGGLIKGVGAGGRAGWAVMHFAPQEWYIWIGTPDDRCGISAGVGPIRANLTSYFMVGTKILNSPPPPDIVSEILGDVDLDYMGDLNALGEGSGFAFGAALDVDTGDLGFLIFYARFQAGLGFDIMLKNYGDNAQCKGRSDPLGVNGWYANGQAYAYFDGDIGIRVKVFGRRKNISILQIGAAAVLQAKLPNPFWMRGIVGGRFRVLGGLVKGNCKFEVTLGEECEIIGGSVLDNIQVIADGTPKDSEKDVNVFNTPQAVFNMPIDKVFELVDVVDDIKKSFRIKLDHFKLVSDGKELQGNIEWNEEKDVAAFNSHDVYPSKKKVELKIRVIFEEKKNGVWNTVVIDGREYFEELNTSFTSGVAPDYIPHSNVAYSYPVIDQYNFHVQEYNKGYIKLEKGQPYLFDIGDEWKQIGRFTTSNGDSKVEFDFGYNSSSKQVNFSLPTGMKNDKIYSFQLINTPAQATGKIDRNVKERVNKGAIGGESLDTEVTAKSAEGTIDQLQEKVLFATHIRSSKYATFSQKIDNQSIFATYRGLLIPWSIHFLKSYITTTEYFDATEIKGVSGTNLKPLVSLEADVSTNDYFSRYIQPLVYANYPLDGDIRITYRDINELGLIPIKAVNIYQNKENRILNDSDIASGSIVDNSNTLDYRYGLAYYYAYDFYEIQNKVVQRYINQAYHNDRVNDIIWSQYPVMPMGDYKVKLIYTLPGQSSANSSKIITLKYGE